MLSLMLKFFIHFFCPMMSKEKQETVSISTFKRGIQFLWFHIPSALHFQDIPWVSLPSLPVVKEKKRLHGMLTPQQKYPTPTSQTFYSPLRLETKNMKMWKLMHKSLIQQNSWQTKKQSEIWRNTVNLMQTLTFRLNIN